MLELILSEPTTDRYFLQVLCFVSAVAEVDNGDKIIGVNFAAGVPLNGNSKCFSKFCTKWYSKYFRRFYSNYYLIVTVNVLLKFALNGRANISDVFTVIISLIVTVNILVNFALNGTANISVVFTVIVTLIVTVNVVVNFALNGTANISDVFTVIITLLH